jgi:hypothetical protein
MANGIADEVDSDLTEAGLVTVHDDREGCVEHNVA